MPEKTIYIIKKYTFASFYKKQNTKWGIWGHILIAPIQSPTTNKNLYRKLSAITLHIH